MARAGFGRKTSNGTGSIAGGTQAAIAAPMRVPAPTATAREVKPSIEQVRSRAYELYQQRSRAGRPGDSTTDWLEAERQLRLTPPNSGR